MSLEQAYALSKHLSEEQPQLNRRSLSQPESFVADFSQRSFKRGTIAERFHEYTKVTEQYKRRRQKTETELAASGVSALLETHHPERELTSRIELAKEETVDGDVILRGSDEVSNQSLTESTLGTLLSDSVGLHNGENAYSSAGDTYSVETYVLTEDGPPQRGIFYYTASDDALVPLEGNPDSAYETLDRTDAPVLICLSGVFPRTKIRFGERGYRYTLQEAGAVSQTMKLVGSTLGLEITPVFECNDDAFNDILELNGVDESVIQVLEVNEK